MDVNIQVTLHEMITLEPLPRSFWGVLFPEQIKNDRTDTPPKGSQLLRKTQCEMHRTYSSQSTTFGGLGDSQETVYDPRAFSTLLVSNQIRPPAIGFLSPVLGSTH